jgi:hypothetical protein
MPIEIREPYAMTRRFKAALPRITPDRTGPRIHRRQKLQKQRAMHKQLAGCELRIAKLCVELDTSYTSAQTKKEQPKGCSFQTN